MWRVYKGLHKSITYSFLPVRHKICTRHMLWPIETKTSKSSSPQLGRDSKCSERVSQRQCPSVGTQDGKTFVPVFDWQVHLSPHFKKFPMIKKWHAFITTLDNKGRLSIKVKRYSNTPEIHVDILKDDLPSDMPTTWFIRRSKTLSL